MSRHHRFRDFLHGFHRHEKVSPETEAIMKKMREVQERKDPRDTVAGRIKERFSRPTKEHVEAVLETARILANHPSQYNIRTIDGAGSAVSTLNELKHLLRQNLPDGVRARINFQIENLENTIKEVNMREYAGKTKHGISEKELAHLDGNLHREKNIVRDVWRSISDPKHPRRRTINEVIKEARERKAELGKELEKARDNKEHQLVIDNLISRMDEWTILEEKVKHGER